MSRLALSIATFASVLGVGRRPAIRAIESDHRPSPSLSIRPAVDITHRPPPSKGRKNPFRGTTYAAHFKLPSHA